MLPRPFDNFVEVPALVNNIPRALVAIFPIMHSNICLASEHLSEKFNAMVCRVSKVNQRRLPLTEKSKKAERTRRGKPRRGPCSILESSYNASLI